MRPGGAGPRPAAATAAAVATHGPVLQQRRGGAQGLVGPDEPEQYLGPVTAAADGRLPVRRRFAALPVEPLACLEVLQGRGEAFAGGLAVAAVQLLQPQAPPPHAPGDPALRPSGPALRRRGPRQPQKARAGTGRAATAPGG